MEKEDAPANKVEEQKKQVDIEQTEVKVEQAKQEEQNSAEEKEEKGISKKEGKYILLTIAVIVLILAVSLGGFNFFETQAPGALPIDKLHELNIQGKLDPERGYMYNGFSFVKDEGLWWTTLSIADTLFKVPVHFGPKEVEHIKITGKLAPEFNHVPDVFLVIDPKITNKYYTLAISEISFNLAQVMNRAPIGSCSEDHPSCEGRQIITCENTGGQPVIQLELAEEPGVEFSGTCIKVKGQEYELTKAVDRLLFHQYNII